MKHDFEEDIKLRFLYRMPGDVLSFVDQVAKSLCISRNSAISLIIRHYMAEHPDKPKKVCITGNGFYYID